MVVKISWLHARGRVYRLGKYCFLEYAMYMLHPRYVTRVMENKAATQDLTTFNGEIYAVTFLTDGDPGSSRIL